MIETGEQEQATRVEEDREERVCKQGKEGRKESQQRGEKEEARRKKEI